MKNATDEVHLIAVGDYIKDLFIKNFALFCLYHMFTRNIGDKKRQQIVTFSTSHDIFQKVCVSWLSMNYPC